MSTRIAFARGVYAVKPSKFGTNVEALADNKFMQQADNQDGAEFNEIIQSQHSQFVQNMLDNAIDVTVFPQLGDDAPDSVFPDWFTCYKGDSVPEGVLIIHPMKYKSRRNERTPELISILKQNYRHVIDLTHFEDEGKALEGKGSIVFDHRNRNFYVALSNRSHLDVINELVAKFNDIAVDTANHPYKAVTFEAKDQRGDVIYHTDCLMTLLAQHVMICLDAIRDLTQRNRLISALTQGEYPVQILELSLDQIEHMAANAQNVTNDEGEQCVVQSHQGYSSLTVDQKKVLNDTYRMVVSKVDMIEQVGGGSCRCMLVENWSTVDTSSLMGFDGFDIKLSHCPTDKPNKHVQPKSDGFFNDDSLEDDLSSAESSQDLSQTSFQITNHFAGIQNFFDDQDMFDEGVYTNYWDHSFNDAKEDLLDLGDSLTLTATNSKIQLQKRFPMSRKSQSAVGPQVTELNLRQIATVAERPSALQNVVKNLSSLLNFGDMTSAV